MVILIIRRISFVISRGQGRKYSPLGVYCNKDLNDIVRLMWLKDVLTPP